VTLPARVESARVKWWLRACAQVGADARLRGRPSVYASPGRILIGDHLRLSSRPVASHLVAGPDGLLDIGHDVSIAHGAAIAAFERVGIGDGTCIGPFVVIMDTNFHGATGDQSVQHDCRPVIIGRDCRIGSRVTITRGATIGDGAEILAGSVVSSAIPAGACAGGARARVFGRAGEAASRWNSAAAVLPELVAEVLELDSRPDLASDPWGLPGWDDRLKNRLRTALENQFGVALDPEVLTNARHLADIAMAVERARSLDGL
jgi:acetyltransferase-like isoleucine patch superfamily enzyme